ncbi:MAG: hypothetical protein A4E64_01100 [Syntrophorhabdus sp. PtaU1.Bin058]|nr:MAG: hypothetical protein A4E64_01100 [Syntrophorhabdus sp. PtaU1.Bin058]
MVKDYSLYLRVGDRVYHKYFKRWGLGIVVEERRSELPGGFCYVRINFQDGKLRVFDNNFKSGSCCYYAGIEKIDDRRYKIERREERQTRDVRPLRKALLKGKE